MSAPMLNASSFQPPGAAAGTGQGVGAVHAGALAKGGALAGFEALIAALFGQVAPGEATTAAPGATTTAAPPTAGQASDAAGAKTKGKDAGKAAGKTAAQTDTSGA